MSIANIRLKQMHADVKAKLALSTSSNANILAENREMKAHYGLLESQNAELQKQVTDLTNELVIHAGLRDTYVSCGPSMFLLFVALICSLKASFFIHCFFFLSLGLPPH